jgi:hypothetical protein
VAEAAVAESACYRLRSHITLEKVIVLEMAESEICISWNTSQGPVDAHYCSPPELP